MHTIHEKPHTHAVALVIENDAGEVLAVKRPEDDADGLTSWGLPATSLRAPGESWEQAAHRAAREKLGVSVVLGECMGEQHHERETYLLTLRDYRARISEGEPHVPQTAYPHAGTQYTDWKWTSEWDIFIPTARKGSVCTRIFLDAKGIRWRA